MCCVLCMCIGGAIKEDNSAHKVHIHDLISAIEHSEQLCSAVGDTEPSFCDDGSIPYHVSGAGDCIYIISR